MASLLRRRYWLRPLGYTQKQIVGLSSAQMRRLAYVGILAAVFGAPERVVIPLNVRAQKRLHGAMDQALDTLTMKEASVLRLRFGVECGQPHTMYEIATIYGVTGERIRQIECKALRKLKHPSRSHQLFPFIVR